MTKSAAKLKYKRQAWSGTYYAKSDTHTFAVDKVRSTWQLRIWGDGGKMIHFSDDHRTMTLAKLTAQHYADHGVPVSR
jgi:hypothetical protein